MIILSANLSVNLPVDGRCVREDLVFFLSFLLRFPFLVSVADYLNC